MKPLSVLLVLSLFLGGCLAPPLKPPVDRAGRIRAIRVVALESPPLEVIPDPIETRVPIYRQSEQVPADLFLERRLYRSAGGVMMAGLVAPGAGDGVETLPAEPVAAPGPHWEPAAVLAAAAVSQLAGSGLRATAGADSHPLAVTERERRSADPLHWQEAIRRWYGQERSAAGGEPAGAENAVLEVGVGRYRIFHGRLALQALVKLVEPATGRVLGRSSAQARLEGSPTPGLRDRDAAAFKQLVADAGGRLVAQALNDLGLASGASGEVAR